MGQDNIENLFLIGRKWLDPQMIEYVLDPAMTFDPCPPGFHLDQVDGVVVQAQERLGVFFIPYEHIGR